jgi:hypothetical protein
MYVHVLTAFLSSDEIKNLLSRIRLDRRRFESGHLKYAMLMTVGRYQQISGVPITMSSDVTDMLEKFTPKFYDAFTTKYSGEKWQIYR